MRNTGKSSEGILDAAFTRAGAFVYRLNDAAHIRGMNGGRPVRAPPVPADFIIFGLGNTCFAEVKSTSDPDRFSFSMLETEQRKTGIKAVRIGADYDVFVHHLPTDRWYRIPYRAIMMAEDSGKKSLRWDELDLYEWSLPQ